jgi:ABC-2 type transport system ATP-binding protein
MTQPAIQIRGLHKTFRVGFSGLKSVEALRGVDLTVQTGEIYGFLGPNGAGKSTTIKILTRLIHPTSGDALVFGEPLEDPKARRRVGYLPENPVFYDYLTGTEFLLYYASLLGVPKGEARDRARRLLERVGIPGAAKLQLRRYSKGMIQRIGIAQALLGDPELVILDEPVSGLDPIGRREMRELMMSLKEQGKTVFFSTHIIPDVEMICDRVGIIIGGRVVREGTVADLLAGGQDVTEVVVTGIGRDATPSLPDGVQMRDAGAQLSILVPQSVPIEDVLRRLMDAGARLVAVQGRGRALEDLFIDEIEARDEGGDAPRAAVRKGAA